MDKIWTAAEKKQTPLVASHENASNQGADLNVTVTALKPPPGRTCLDVIFGDFKPVPHVLPFNHLGKVADIGLDEVCRLSFSVDVGETNKYVVIWVDVKSGRYIETMPRPKTLSGSTSTSGRQSWSIELPRKMDKPFLYAMYTASNKLPASCA